MKTHPKIIDRILEGIRQSRTICVVGHIRPDGDCIGSQLGLSLALRDQGRRVTCWNEDAMPDKLAFLDPERVIARDLSHSKGEPRFYCFGETGGGVLTVRFTYRGDVIRIFGAGYWRRGKRIYEAQSKVPR